MQFDMQQFADEPVETQMSIIKHLRVWFNGQLVAQVTTDDSAGVWRQPSASTQQLANHKAPNDES